MRGGAIIAVVLALLLFRPRQRPARPGRWFGWDEVYQGAFGGDAETDANAMALARQLDTYRDYIGQPVGITRWHSTADENAAIGGAESSQHLTASAADLVTAGYSSEEQARAYLDSGAEFDQLIWYPTSPHIHVSYRRGGPQRGEVRFAAYDGSYPFRRPEEAIA